MSSISRVSDGSSMEERKDPPALLGKRRTREGERVAQVSVLSLGRKNGFPPVPFRPQAAEASEDIQKPIKRVLTAAEKRPSLTGIFGSFSPQSSFSPTSTRPFSPQSSFSPTSTRPFSPQSGVDSASSGFFSPWPSSDSTSSVSFSPQSSSSVASSEFSGSIDPNSTTCLANYTEAYKDWVPPEFLLSGWPSNNPLNPWLTSDSASKDLFSPSSTMGQLCSSSGSARMTDSSSSNASDPNPQSMQNLTVCASPRLFGRSLIGKTGLSIPTTSSAAAALAMSSDSSARPASTSFEPIREEDSPYSTTEQESPRLQNRRIPADRSNEVVSQGSNSVLGRISIPGDLSPFRSEGGSPGTPMFDRFNTFSSLSKLASIRGSSLFAPRKLSPDLNEEEGSKKVLKEPDHSGSESDDGNVGGQRTGSSLSSMQMFNSYLTNSPGSRSESPTVENLGKDFQSIAMQEKSEESEK